MTQQGQQVTVRGVSAEHVSHFFALDSDLKEIARQIDVDPVIHAALQRYRGLRIIRQDPWECTASFILSSFNNILRLTGMIETLSLRFGDQGVFPRPEALAKVSERVLRNCGLGFRAPYLKTAAQAVASGSAPLEDCRRLEDDELRRSLCKIPGVGEKVVECILLFAYGRAAAFPVDVWIGRSMRAWYFRNRKVTDRQLREFARKHFGPYCGWAQQYLYCTARSGTNE